MRKHKKLVVSLKLTRKDVSIIRQLTLNHISLTLHQPRLGQRTGTTTS